MINRILPLLTFILLSGSTANAQDPVFKSCDCSTSHPRHHETLDSLKELIQTGIIQKIGYELNDSIYLKFQYQEEEIEIKEGFNLHSDRVLKESKLALAALTPLLCESETPSQMWFNYQVAGSFENYKSVEQASRPLPVVGTKDFNLSARRGAARYLAYTMEKAIKDSLEINSSLSGQLYFNEGTISAIEYTSLDKSTYLSDFIVPFFYEANQVLVDAEEVKQSDQQYLSFSIKPYRDSAESYAYGLVQLEYLKSLKQKKPYLHELISFSSSHFEEKEKAAFITDQLLGAGYDVSDKFTMNGRTYRIDSIAKYTPSEDEGEDDVLNFSMVESVPVFKDCDHLNTNEERKLCFQQGVLKHVGSSFIYPEMARQAGIQGRTYTTFVIEKNGSIGAIEIVRGVHPLLDLESIRVVSTLPKIKPAMQRGKAVRMSFTLPINAKLE